MDLRLRKIKSPASESTLVYRGRILFKTWINENPHVLLLRRLFYSTIRLCNFQTPPPTLPPQTNSNPSSLLLSFRHHLHRKLIHYQLTSPSRIILKAQTNSRIEHTPSFNYSPLPHQSPENQALPLIISAAFSAIAYIVACK